MNRLGDDAPALVVGVVGAGTMGAGIAQVCLQAGHDVLIHDVDEAAVDRARVRISEGLERLVARGKADPDAPPALLGRLRRAATLDALAAESDLVVEAALEELELKRTIFRALDAASPPDVPLATNTSALSVTAIAEATAAPGRVLGLHFFNPAPVMALVEVVAADRTDAAVVRLGLGFTAGLGKTPVTCRDSPGFIVNRVNRPFTLEALRMLEAREGSVEAIDEALEGAGYPMGPFALMDLVGIDVNLAVARALHQAFVAERFRPSLIQAALVQRGRLGRKTGQGFYRYGSDGKAVAPAGDDVLPEPPAVSLPAQRIVERIEFAIVNEAYHAVGEDVAEPADIDLALRLGAGHPRGPFERAGELGLRAIVQGLAALEASHGERFRPARALRQLATL